MGRAGGKGNRLLGLSLGMESEGERIRGSRAGLLLVLVWNLRHNLLAIQLSHRQMSSQLALLIRTSGQHSVWKMDRILVEVDLDKAQEAKEDLEDVGALAVMEELAQVVASKEEMEAAEVGEETEVVVGMEEEVERVLSEVSEVLEVLVVLVV